MRAAPAAALAAALFFATPLARSQPEVPAPSLTVEPAPSLTVEPQSWPLAASRRGWQCTQFRFANESGQRFRLEFELTSRFLPEHAYVLKDVIELQPGEVLLRTYPVLAPPQGTLDWSAVEREAGLERSGELVVGNGQAPWDGHAIGYYGGRKSALSHSAPASPWLLVATDQTRAELSALARSWHDSTLASPWLVEGDAVPPAAWLGGLMLAFAHVEDSALDANGRAELLAFARLGGALVVFHEGEDALAARWPELTQALRAPRPLPVEPAPGLRAVALGHGRLFTIDSRAQATPVPFATALGRGGWPLSWLPWHDGAHLPLWAQYSGPVRVSNGLLIALLAALSLLIGPWSFFRARRSGRPASVLWRTPLLGLAGCGALGLAAAATFGIDVRRDSWSLTILDAAGGTASTMEARALHSGVARTLQAPPGGFVLPVYEPPSDAARGRVLPGVHRVDATDGYRWSGEILPGRRVVQHLVGWDRPSRVRLSVRREGDRLVAENALGAGVDALFVATADGGVWSLEAPLARGATAPLRRLDPDDAAAVLASASTAFGGEAPAPPASFQPFIALRTGLRRSGVALTPGTFLARVDGPVFCDDGGFPMDEESGCHVVFGVLDADAATGGAPAEGGG